MHVNCLDALANVQRDMKMIENGFKESGSGVKMCRYDQDKEKY